MIELKANRTTILDNCICVYCADPLQPDATTEEHVIGRKFVPVGTLNANWNLIVNACPRCNNLKSDLEDDISAITMQPDITGQHAHANLRIAEIATRKAAGAISRHTKRPVNESREEITLKGGLGPNVSMSFGFIGHPHISEERAFSLAEAHLTAFFFFITYDEKMRRGYYWRGGFQPVMMVRREDWGNERIRAFADAVDAWPSRFYTSTAEGFFKLVVRRHPAADCWSWAMEWNQTARLIGFFGDQDAADATIAGLPTLKMEKIARASDGAVMRMRLEQALDPAADILFECEG